MIALANTTNVLIDNIDSNSASDGIHLMGKNYNTSIENISGICGDDMVAVTTLDYAAYAIEEGDVSDLKIRNVSGTNATRIILLGNTKYTIKNVQIENVDQIGTGAVINIGDGGELADASVFIDRVYIRNANAVDNVNSRIMLRHKNIGEIVMENINCGVYLARETNGNVNVDKLIVKNINGALIAESHVAKMTTVYLENVFNSINLSNVGALNVKNMIRTGLNHLVVESYGRE